VRSASSALRGVRDRDGTRRCVLVLNVATDDALATGATLLDVTRAVFCAR
jgi:hypothetical protein